MATVMDTLETVMKLTGAQTYATQMGALSTSLEKVAVSEVGAGSQAGALGGALEALGASTGIAGAAIALVTAGIGASIAAFSESEDTIARLAIRMRNLGNVFPIKALTEFSGALGQQLGIDDELIAKLGAAAAGFGLTRQQIEKLLPAVLDISVGLKESPEELLNKLLHAARGRPQGLVSLGIDPAKIKGDLKDINNLISQIGQGFEGTAAAFRNTLPGAIGALQVSVGNMAEAFGRLFSPLIVGLLEDVIFKVDLVTKLITGLADFLHIPTAADIGGPGASKIAFKGDPEQTEYQRQTAENTKKLHDAFIRDVLGGPGAVAKNAFTARDAKIAFGV